MRSSRASLGALLAGLAAIVLAIDTWQTWYALRIPAAVLNQVDSLARRFGSFGSYLHAGVSYARRLGPIPLTAHDVFRAIDVELVLIAVAAVGIIVAGELRGRPLFADGDGGAVAALGAIAFGIVAFRIVSPPGPVGVLELRAGVWVALVCSAAVLVGGLLCRGARVRAPASAVAVPPADLSW